MNTKTNTMVMADDYQAAGFAQYAEAGCRWMKHLGNRCYAVLSDEAGREPRSGSDLLVLLVHRDEREREVTIMEQYYGFGDVITVLHRFAKVRSSTACVTMKDDKHGDFVAWFNDGSVACGVAEKGRPFMIPAAGDEAEKVAVMRENIQMTKANQG